MNWKTSVSMKFNDILRDLLAIAWIQYHSCYTSLYLIRWSAQNVVTYSEWINIINQLSKRTTIFNHSATHTNLLRTSLSKLCQILISCHSLLVTFLKKFLWNFKYPFLNLQTNILTKERFNITKILSKADHSPPFWEYVKVVYLYIENGRWTMTKSYMISIMQMIYY